MGAGGGDGAETSGNAVAAGASQVVARLGHRSHLSPLPNGGLKTCSFG